MFINASIAVKHLYSSISCEINDCESVCYLEILEYDNILLNTDKISETVLETEH